MNMLRSIYQILQVFLHFLLTKHNKLEPENRLCVVYSDPLLSRHDLTEIEKIVPMIMVMCKARYIKQVPFSEITYVQRRSPNGKGYLCTIRDKDVLNLEKEIWKWYRGSVGIGSVPLPPIKRLYIKYVEKPDEFFDKVF